MQITLRLFAILKDRAGFAETALDLPAGATVASALDEVIRKFPPIERDITRIAVAVNRNYVPRETPLNEGDELALIPPVSGG